MNATARSESTDRRFYGVFEGIVTKVGDEEKEGQVKLRLPWLNDEMETEWCPVLQFFAGPGHGSFFIPEVGSLVLCSARHGDLRFPVVLGGLYNGVDKPAVDHERLRHIQSVNGHKITFIDSNGDSAGGIVIEDASGCQITLSSTGTVVVKAMGALTLDAPIITFKGPGYRRVLSPNSNPI